MRLSWLMNVRIEGDAKDAIVLAHGFGSDQGVWDALTTWQAVLKTYLRDRLPACHVPTVVIETANDPSVPAATTEYLHAYICGREFGIIETEGHFPRLAAPELVLASLRRHIRQLA